MKALKRGSLSEKEKRFVLLGKVEKRSVKLLNWVQSVDHSEAKGNLCTLLFQFSSAVEDCRTKQGTEDLSKMRVVSGKRMDNSSSKLTKAVCFLTSVISHDTKRFLVQLIKKENGSPSGVRPCYFLQSRASKEDRS